MAKLTTGQKRSVFTLVARGAIRKGTSISAFILQAKAGGYSFRRSDMLREWRNLTKVEASTKLFQFIRKDRLPTAKVIAQVDWAMSREYMYKVKVTSRLRPGEKEVIRFVNIMHDRRLTPGEVEAITWAMIQEQSPPVVSQIIKIVPETVIQRIYQ